MESKVLVLDMDETLIHTLGASARIELLTSYPNATAALQACGDLFGVRFERTVRPSGTDREEDVLVIKRPGVDEFLRRARKTFSHVLIWSAGQKEYVEKVIDGLFERHPPPDLVMTYDDIHHESNGYSKPLSRVYEKVDAASPKNTILVDDCESNFIHDTNNGVKIKRYAPAIREIITGQYNTDTELYVLADYFADKSFASARDVRTIGLEKAVVPHIIRPSRPKKQPSETREKPTFLSGPEEKFYPEPLCLVREFDFISRPSKLTVVFEEPTPKLESFGFSMAAITSGCVN